MTVQKNLKTSLNYVWDVQNVAKNNITVQVMNMFYYEQMRSCGKGAYQSVGLMRKQFFSGVFSHTAQISADEIWFLWF